MKRHIFCSICLSIALSLSCGSVMANSQVISRTNQQMSQMNQGASVSVSHRGMPRIEKGPKKVSIGVESVPLRDAGQRETNYVRSTDFFGLTAASSDFKADADKEGSGAPKNGTVFFPIGASKAFDNGTVTFP